MVNKRLVTGQVGEVSRAYVVSVPRDLSKELGISGKPLDNFKWLPSRIYS